MKIKEKIPNPSSAEEEIGLKNRWWMVSKGCRPKDDDKIFDEDNEVTILMPSFIDYLFIYLFIF